VLFVGSTPATEAKVHRAGSMASNSRHTPAVAAHPCQHDVADRQLCGVARSQGHQVSVVDPSAHRVAARTHLNQLAPDRCVPRYRSPRAIAHRRIAFWNESGSPPQVDVAEPEVGPHFHDDTVIAEQFACFVVKFDCGRVACPDTE
jgi:hypothetical protein